MNIELKAVRWYSNKGYYTVRYIFSCDCGCDKKADSIVVYTPNELSDEQLIEKIKQKHED